MDSKFDAFQITFFPQKFYPKSQELGTPAKGREGPDLKKMEEA